MHWAFTTEVPVGQPIVSAAILRVAATSPKNGDVRVPLTKRIKVSFSEPMSAGAVTLGAFVSDANGAFIKGTWRVKNNDAFFGPSQPLLPSSVYTVDVLQTVVSIAGNTVATPFTFSFTTVASATPPVQPPTPPTPTPTPPTPPTPPVSPPADTTPPTLVGLNPVNGELNVAVSRAIIATFSEPIEFFTVQNGTGILVVTAANVPVLGTWSNALSTVTFTPTNPLIAGTAYSVLVTPSLKDLAGNKHVGTVTASFTTAGVPPPPDTTPPTLAAMNPGIGSTNVPLNSTVELTFSEPILMSSAPNGVMVGGPAGQLAGVWTGVSRATVANPGRYAIIFTPDAPLLPGVQQYWFSFLNSAPGVGLLTDLAGNPFDTTNWPFIVFTTIP